MEPSNKFADCLDWRADSDWYFYDEDRQYFALTDKAPPEARRSFAHWRELVDADKSRRKLEDNWRADSDWYFYDEDRQYFALTDKAPPEARRSFAHWRELVDADKSRCKFNGAQQD